MCKANVEARDNNNNTPLIKAFENHDSRYSVVKYLCEHCHSNLGATGRDGFTLVDLAVKSSELGIVKFLYEKCQDQMSYNDRSKANSFIREHLENS